MNKNVTVTAPCEVCGGLLPLKPRPPRRRGKQRQSQPTQKELPCQPKDISKGGDSHHPQTEEGSTSQDENSGELETSLPLPKNSGGQVEETSGSRRSYNSVLEEIQAIFAGQKVKKETISPYVQRDHRQRERKSNKLKQHERSQAHQHVASRPAAVLEHKPSTSTRPADVNVSCLLHPDQKQTSNCSFDPLSISLSKNADVAQSCTHHLGEYSRRAQLRGGAECSSPPRDVSKKETNSNCRRHGAVDDYHQDACRPAPISPRNTQPCVANESFQDVIRLHEECHIHQVDKHRRGSKKFQRHGHEPPQSFRTCHQHIWQQTVDVLHHKGCHPHRRDEPQSTKGERCGCSPDRDYSFKIEAPLQEPADGIACHHSSKTHVRSPQQEVTACVQKQSAYKPHGDCSEEKIDVCRVCCHPKEDHKDLQRKASEDQTWQVLKHSCRDEEKRVRKEKVQGCYLHGEPPSSPKCQEPKDPLVWTPRRVRKPRQCSSVHWLDRLVASQKIPSHIIQQFLQGKRRWPPQVKKQMCLGCIGKLRDKNVSSTDPCRREFAKPSAEPWNSDIAEFTVECKQRRRRKLSRLAMSRTLMTKPVVKLSTSTQELWSRKEFQVCSECRDPVKRRGLWTSILEETSTDFHEGREISTCKTKLSCQTVHGYSKPCETQAMTFRCPELFSVFRLRSKLQKIQDETFDRRAAMQVAQLKGIELDQEVLDLLPESKKPQKVIQKGYAKVVTMSATTTIGRYTEAFAKLLNLSCQPVDCAPQGARKFAPQSHQFD